MRNFNFRFFLSALTIYSIMMAAGTAKAAPVQFTQVVQLVNAKPGKANTGSFAQLRLAGDDLVLVSNDDAKTVESVAPQDDPRVITETRSEIIEEEVCDCEIPTPGGFPYWTLGFAAVPFLFLIPPGDDGDNPPSSPTTTPTGTPTATPTATPTPTTPTPTPTPPTEPVPEPMTILLFGTGLASIGLAARRRYGKRKEDEAEG